MNKLERLWKAKWVSLNLWNNGEVSVVADGKLIWNSSLDEAIDLLQAIKRRRHEVRL